MNHIVGTIQFSGEDREFFSRHFITQPTYDEDEYTETLNKACWFSAEAVNGVRRGEGELEILSSEL